MIKYLGNKISETLVILIGGCMEQYRLQGETYVIENFDKLPAFSSFLPGLAGIKGIPIWVFYTNRGQGINSFGIHNKSNAIMEFNPANTAYENTGLKGFRTFIKIDNLDSNDSGTPNDSSKIYYEPFLTSEGDEVRTLYIDKNSFTIEEVNNKYKIKVRVKYYVLPEDRIGGLVRKVMITNLGNENRRLEVLDGMSKIIPYGIANGAYKEMSNLLKSWSEVKNGENNVPVYTMTASSDDNAEVNEIDGGYFYLSINQGEVLPVLYDSDLVFGYETSLIKPIHFIGHNVKDLVESKQCFYNKVPCGFSVIEKEFHGDETYEFNSFIGYTNSVEEINESLTYILKEEFFVEKEKLADELVSEFTKDVKTNTGLPVFDKYIEQCYLDNFLRGGYPFVFNKETNPSVVHLFSRKHGDPERDYNFFSITGEFYSQGNGNFRDVNQNRRNDVFFNKDIGDFNIKTFFQLIQLDGYNPLEVRPTTFVLKENRKEEIISYIKENAKGNINKLIELVQKPFTPGQIAKTIGTYHISTKCGEDVLTRQILDGCNQQVEAGFGEGYWSDHFGYNMDLIEDYLKIYPDRIEELLLLDDSYRYYDSPALVLKRSEKYVLAKKGVRQYGALIHDEDKISSQGFKNNGTNWIKTRDEKELTTTLLVKLITLALNKFSCLDPYGIGVEMEGGKPGWNDAMNGLPGLFGSGISETIELKRIVEFLCKTLNDIYKVKEQRELETITVTMPVEIYEFLLNVYSVLNELNLEHIDDFTYWDKVSTLREEYRDKVHFHVTGEDSSLSILLLQEILSSILHKVNVGIDKAKTYGDGIIPTYFTYYVTKYEEVLDEENNNVLSHYGLPKVVVKEFSVKPLPAFLEGPARILKVMDCKDEASRVYNNVKNSSLYDEKLKMYKTSVPIDDISMEHGRIRAFTPGWLERESVFLHMEYKYIYGLLKASLYDEFFEEMKNTFIPFLNPSEYGRSILENSSFIVTSVNPDESIHKRGYVARLSGSTVEVLSMWIEMFIGNKIFTYDKGELVLHLLPNLPHWMFNDENKVSFTLFSNCEVVYLNPKLKNTYGEDSVQVQEINIVDTGEIIIGNQLTGEYANKVREGKITKIIATLM